MMLSLRAGATDRGACIRDLSQYPGEAEHLFPPCSLLSGDGPVSFRLRDDGLGVRVLPVRIRGSPSARTVEDLVGEKKGVHMAAFRHQLGETDSALRRIAAQGGDGGAPAADAPARAGAAARRLACDVAKHEAGPRAVEGLVERIVGECEERLRRHEAVDARAYADGRVSQRLAEEMLDTRRWAVSKLRLWLEDPAESILHVVNYPLHTAHRLLTRFLRQCSSRAGSSEEKRAAALAVCQARGLLSARIDEVNAQGEDPLAAAAADGSAAADIRALVDAGAAVNGPGGASRALFAAATYGHVEAVAALLEAKAAVDAPDPVMRLMRGSGA
jgi:hypothetical protein